MSGSLKKYLLLKRRKMRFAMQTARQSPDEVADYITSVSRCVYGIATGINSRRLPMEKFCIKGINSRLNFLPLKL